MAAIAITPLVLTTRDSTKSGQLTWSAVTTNPASGAYLDLTGYKGNSIIIVATMTATNVTATLGGTVRVQATTNSKFSGYGKGDLAVTLSSAVVDLPGGAIFMGPYDLSRFKDSNERIQLKCTRGNNIASFGAIIIE